MSPHRAKRSIHRSRKISHPASKKHHAVLRSRTLHGRKKDTVPHEGRQNWKAIFDSSQDGVLIADIARKRFLSCNKRITKMLGFSEAELLTLSVKNIHPPQELKRVLAAFDLLVKGRASVVNDVPMERKDGSLFYAEISGSCIELFGRKCLVGFFRDVTERKRAEEEARQALSLERATLESTADGILVVDGRTGKVTDFNDRFSQLWKIPKKIFRSKEDKRLLRYVLSQLKDPKRFLSKVEELYRHPRKNSFDVLEFKDGRVFERYSHPQVLDGKPVGRVWSFRDVTKHKRVEADLQTSEQRYRNIFEFSHDAMMTLDPPSWRFTSANASMVRMFRAKSAAELLSRSPWELSPKEQPDGRASAEKAREMIQTGLRRGGYFFEWMHRRLDGTTFPAEVLLTRVARDEGVFLQATVRDITERKRAEEAILKVSQFNESIISSLPGIFYIFDSKGKPWQVNKKFLEVTGYSLKQVLKMRPMDFFSGKDKTKVENKIREVFEKGESFTEADFLNKNGKKTPYYLTGIRVTIQGQSLLVGVGIDITARKQAEDFLREHRHQLLQVIDTVPHMIFAEDGKGRFLLVNQAVAHAYGKEPGELIGVRRQDVHKVQGEAESYLKIDREVLASGKAKVLPGEFFTDHRGRRRILQTIKIPFKMVGAKEKCILGVSVDVTEQKKVEEFRNEIVRTVSHELRTPLSIQKEGISLLMDEIAGPVNKEQKEVLVAVMRNIERLARMITNLLDISSIESGRIRLSKKVTDLTALVKDVVFGFKGRADVKAIDLSIQLPKRPVRVFADPDKIAQVLSNMVDNALKFTPERGAIEVSLTALKRDVECEVRDSGIGIAPEYHEKLFEKFQQFSRTVGPGEKGFGLGLSIAKGIIDLHGGRIRVQSKIGQGTRVAFLLPLYSAKGSRHPAGEQPFPKKEI